MSEVHTTFSLTLEEINARAEHAQAWLLKGGIASQEATRARLSLEEVLLNWASVFGRDACCTCSLRRRLGKMAITVTVPGPRANPIAGEAADTTILEQLGLAPAYRYENGENRVTIILSRRQPNAMWVLLLAIAASVVLKLLLGLTPAATQAFVEERLAAPMASAYLRGLATAAGPFIALTFLNSMVGMGDMSSFARVGKRALRMFVLLMCAVTIACIAVGLLVYPASRGGAGAGGMVSMLVDTVLDIVPGSVVTPFASGNMLQILFLSIIAGLAMLALGSRVSVLATVVAQMQAVLQWVLELLSRLRPFYIFFSLVQYPVSSLTGGTGSILTVTLLIAGACVALLAVLLAGVCVKRRMSVGGAVRRLALPFAMAFSSMSSTATLPVVMQSCEEEWGLDKATSSFGLTLGIVMFRAAIAIVSVYIALFAAYTTGTPITAAFLLLLLLATVALAMASPPGGGLIRYTALLAMLGMNIEHVSAVVAISLLLDPLIAATNTSALQMVVILLDRDGRRDRNKPLHRRR